MHTDPHQRWQRNDQQTSFDKHQAKCGSVRTYSHCPWLILSFRTQSKQVLIRTFRSSPTENTYLIRLANRVVG